MPLFQNPQDLWNRMITVAKFLARIPIILLLISGACMVSSLLFLTMYRAVAWLYFKFLAQPWY